MARARDECKVEDGGNSAAYEWKLGVERKDQSFSWPSSSDSDSTVPLALVLPFTLLPVPG